MFNALQQGISITAYISCKGYHGPSADLHVKYLSLASCITYLLKFPVILTLCWTVLACKRKSGLVDQSGSSVWNRRAGAAASQPHVRSATFPFTLILPVWLSRYHYCYGVEPHKRKQPCTEPVEPQHAYTLVSLKSANDFQIENNNNNSKEKPTTTINNTLMKDINEHLEGGIKSALALCTLMLQGAAPSQAYR
ncbi:hypothetical protein T11_1160 [Trichinella zimbabwensis]|uniref:Uncharacterized protein n=1 Tax=Trichinella zimbabwensis TaxID=268475 RepID=A0A0V1HKN9_9BILA|nr:hypothetical protein T11_1160 [Trichinella zimbabwensis]